jgi:hypothetical protein
MSTKLSCENVLPADQVLPAEADYEAAVAEIVGRLSKGWRVSEKTGSTIPVSKDWFPPSKPRRGCEDC